MIPVARNEWLPIGAMMPAATTRRRTMRQASAWFIGWPVNTLAACLGAGVKQPALAVLGDAGSGDVGVQLFGKRVVAWHLVMLATFLVQPQPPARALRPKILHLHRECGGDGQNRRNARI